MILLMFLLLFFILFLYCCLRISSRCSRIEENGYKNDSEKNITDI